MILLNFAHPITDTQRTQIEALADRPIARVIDRMHQFDDSQRLADQVRVLVDSIGLSGQEWQTEVLLVNPPGLAPAALCLMAEIHGRTGYFPAAMRLRPIVDELPGQYELAEIMDLQTVRSEARRMR